MKEIVSIFVFFLLATLLSCAQNDIWEALLPDRDGQYTSKPVYTIHLYKTGNDWMDMDITGEDGELQKGLAWPPARFYDNGDGTVTDTMTGLMWEQSPSSPADTWDASLGYAASKGTGGYFDWRMPNRNELRSLINYQTGTQLSVRLNSQGFAAIQNAIYWTSTTDRFVTASAFTFNMQYGDASATSKSSTGRLWAVRGDSTSIPKTGQTSCWNSSGVLQASCISLGHDGEYQKGVPWPANRFIDNGNSTITDNLTGLVWTQDGNLMVTRGDHLSGWDALDGLTDGQVRWWAQDTIPRTPYEALSYIMHLNSIQYGGYNDWRLPNVNELMSLIHHGESSTATWLNSQGFLNVLNAYYWTSTTHTMWTNQAYRVFLQSGAFSMNPKTTASHYVLAVRGGDW